MSTPCVPYEEQPACRRQGVKPSGMAMRQLRGRAETFNRHENLAKSASIRDVPA
jgi:hypothetical protein